MASETTPTAADVCQHHIDNIEAKRPKAHMRSDLTDALAAAVLDLLALVRDTDEAGRANRAEIDRELSRIRGETAAAPQCGALSERGDRCSLPLGHSRGHVATNSAGAPCVVWG